MIKNELLREAGENIEYIINTYNLKTNVSSPLIHSFGSAEFFIFPIKFNRLLDGVFGFEGDL